MDSASAAVDVGDSWGDPATVEPSAGRPAAILRGNARGLEIVVDGSAPVEAIADAVTGRLDAAPGFFRGTDVRIRVEDGPLAPGCLARLDEITSRFELRIAEVAAGKAPEPEPEPVPVPVPVPVPQPVAVAVAEPEPEPEPVLVSEPPGEPDPAPASPRIVVGPVRSGVLLEHPSHLIIFGDVNPGAEIRAAGNIVVLGRLRGTAHAGIGRDAGFIVALRLEPQQLRIGRVVARADDSDTAASHPEIAHVAGDSIVVEEYRGRLPSALAASLQEELHG